MADAYWKYVESKNKPAALPPHSVKRPRTDYEMPSGHDIPDYFAHEDDRAGVRVIRDTDSINASYDRYLRTAQVPSFGSDSGRSTSNGLDAHHLVDDPRRMAVGGSDLSRPIGISLPADASNTLYVEGLPANCSRREVSHIFRPFLGYKEVRLVTKEPRHSGGGPLVLCFVDFLSPAHAATAMDALQGYKFDEHNRDSANLRLQFARFPGARSAGGQRGNR